MMTSIYQTIGYNSVLQNCFHGDTPKIFFHIPRTPTYENVYRPENKETFFAHRVYSSSANCRTNIPLLFWGKFLYLEVFHVILKIFVLLFHDVSLSLDLEGKPCAVASHNGEWHVEGSILCLLWCNILEFDGGFEANHEERQYNQSPSPSNVTSCNFCYCASAQGLPDNPRVVSRLCSEAPDSPAYISRTCVTYLMQPAYKIRSS